MVLQRMKMLRLSLLILMGILGLRGVECRRAREITSWTYQSTNCRSHTASLTDFGGVGDGQTSNTKAFQAAVEHLSQFSDDGGSQLYVPPGKWLTGCFNLTSHFTLYLHKDAVILGTQDMNEWPLVDPLPSYGRGRDAAGGRYCSLVFGINLTDVVITGDNGTIDGQGEMWWKKFQKKQLKYTRGYLIELMYSDQILISNVTLVNSPSWNIHPVYSSNVIVKGVTILAPVTSKNTDGINPDSSSNVKIEDCYIVSGDDCVAIKSGWDQYGIAFGMPTEHVIIRRLTCISPFSAVIALGSEMSGGIRDVRAEDIVAIHTESGVRIKTAIGRGGYVKDIHVKGMNLHTMKWVFWMTGAYGSHPDDHWDPNAIPVVEGINYRDVVAENVTTAGKLEGLEKSFFKGICISNATIAMAKPKSKKKLPWNCTYVEGTSSSVTPLPCPELPIQEHAPQSCPYPENRLPIDDVEIRECKAMIAHT
ncbi:probable polygalacturonase [Aristolochia californica]|uniref:probable polygalacturonase n=1 Tax=Aristolochia californica TaxID=171875 RepID=UPI0035D96CC6